ncbi:AMP-binding protein [Prauserella muralis]|uniref:Acyl-CoA synthetase n=1 Tax=Prauserella muralis TaxID=588067 RepID=A0A2V4AVA3_9PSEU|nr:AMP-binding protein [Prauserella muralis]PXY19467.1 acyl-CoA synthetase [Prauserella muralis]TWE29444.1 fatty-acyl-CoA synthase [Prauserella muralis]
MDTNLATLLEVVADEAGERVAVVHGETRRTWRELDERASRLAQRFADDGLGEGDRIAIALFNGPEYLETVFALLKLRALPVNVNYRYRERELTELLTDADASAIVFDAALGERIAAVAGRLPNLRSLVRLGAASPAGGLDAADYARVVTETPAMPRIARSGDDGWLMFTGGTTGSPKGVLSRQRWLIGVVSNNGFPVLGMPIPATAEDLRACVRDLIGSGKSLRTLVAPPLMHATGLYLSCGTLLTGGTVVYLPSRSYDPDELASEVERHRVGHVCLVGDVFAVPLADALDEAEKQGRPYDLSSLSRIVSVGVLWSAEVKQRLLRHCDAAMEDLLAASEGGPFAKSVTTRERDGVTARFELLPGAKVLDDDGNDVRPGSGDVGRVSGPSAEGTQYLGDPEKTAQTFRVIRGERFVVTGDLATIDADGALVLLGRDSRVINTGGEKVFAEEVEQVLGEHPAVADVNVVGVPDARWGHRIVAVVALHEGATATETELSEHVGSTLAGYKRPREVIFVPEIQRSPSGKIDLRWARRVATR